MKTLQSPATSLPGVGPVYGAIILAEIGDISRFPSAKQIVSYAGLDATVNESGEFKGQRSSISKRGSPYLPKGALGSCLCNVVVGPRTEGVLTTASRKGKTPWHCHRCCCPKTLLPALCRINRKSTLWSKAM